MTLLEALRFARDLVFPWPDPLPPGYLAAQEQDLTTKIQAIPSDEAALKKYTQTYHTFLEAEEKRRDGVEARLTNIMGLASIAGTIVFGTIVAQLAGTLRISSTALRLGIALGSLYLVMQICSAILRAIAGLSRRSYTALQPADLLEEGSDQSSHFHDLAVEYLRTLTNHRFENDKKVTSMAVAHRAMQQFMWALLVFAILGTYFAIRPQPPQDDLVQTLKKNHELQELLRGPTGPPGPIGPKGDPGITNVQASPVQKPKAHGGN